MNKESVTWRDRLGDRRGRGLIWGLALVAGGAFWLAGNLDLISEPASIVLPGLVILWGIATLFRGRDT